jgi:hypothetical protein
VTEAVKEYTSLHFCSYANGLAISDWPAFATTCAPGSPLAPTIELAPKYSMYFTIASRAWAALANPGKDSLAFCEECRDPLALLLDKTHGAEIRDESVYREFAREWEADFFSDMDALNV